MMLSAESITDEWAAQWNGIPVLIGPHPTDDGQPVSGRSPAIWDSRCAGWLFQARAEQEATDVRRLAAEVWLDVGRVDDVKGLQAVLDQVAAGQPVELSTGFLANVEDRQGMFHGEMYEAVMQPLGADHLVISTEMKGACSVSAGCGLGVNQEDVAVPTPTNQNGGGLKAALARAGELFGLRREKQAASWEENAAHIMAREAESFNTVTPSDQDKQNALCEDLQEKFGTTDKRVVVRDIYTGESLVVFWFMTPFGPDPQGDEFYRVKFAEGADGEYTFDGTPERVRRMTSYEAAVADVAHAANSAGEGAVEDKPCGCQEGAMNETDKKEIGTIIAEALKPVMERVGNVEAAAKTAAEGVVSAAVTEIKTLVAGLTTKVDAATVASNAAVVAANAEREAERKALVTELAGNAKTKELYSAAELESQPLESLRKIAQLAAVEVVSYSGRGAPRTATNAAEPEQAFAEPVPYYKAPTKTENTNNAGAK